RARALELEDWVDGELGPYMRRYAFLELARHRALFGQLASSAAPRWLARFQGAAGAYGRGFTRLRFGAGSDRRADEARERILIALDELEIRPGADEYLLGGRVTAADLPAAPPFHP